MIFNISLHEVCVRVGVHYVITKFSRMDSLPNFLTYGAPQVHASCVRELHYKLEVECGKSPNNMPSDKQIDFSA